MTSIASQLDTKPAPAKIDKALRDYAGLLRREVAGTVRPDDGELLTKLCDVLGYTTSVFLHNHSAVAATVHTLLDEAASESSWRAQCKDRAEKIAGLRHKAHQPDQQAAARAKHQLRQLERERNRGIGGIKKAEQAKADLDRMRTKHAWIAPFISLLDQPKKKRKAKP